MYQLLGLGADESDRAAAAGVEVVHGIEQVGAPDRAAPQLCALVSRVAAKPIFGSRTAERDERRAAELAHAAALSPVRRQAQRDERDPLAEDDAGHRVRGLVHRDDLRFVAEGKMAATRIVTRRGNGPQQRGAINGLRPPSKLTPAAARGWQPGPFGRDHIRMWPLLPAALRGVHSRRLWPLF